MKRAAAIPASNPDTASLIPAPYQTKVCSILSSNGISALELAAALPPRQRPEGFVVLFVAMLEPRKAGTLAIKAFEWFSRSFRPGTLIIIGEGPERQRLESLSSDLGISDRVRFLGGLSRPEVLGWMKAADVFLFPSLRDSGGFVLLEAMMTGLPIVCLDLGGPGYFVTTECGIKVRAGDLHQVLTDLGESIGALARNSALRRKMGEAGKRRVHDFFEWDRKGEQMMQIYQDAARHPVHEPGRTVAAGLTERGN